MKVGCMALASTSVFDAKFYCVFLFLDILFSIAEIAPTSINEFACTFNYLYVMVFTSQIIYSKNGCDIVAFFEGWLLGGVLLVL